MNDKRPETESPLLVEISELVVQYDQVRALRGVDISVPAGQIIGVVGPNGAGKTSLMHAIVGVVTASGGTVKLEGEAIQKSGLEAIARRGVRLVPEGRRILTTLTVEENLRLGATGRRGQAVETDLERIFERFPILEERRTQPAGQLSGGEQQMLAIGRALAARPRVLLLDEPTLGLAPRVVDDVFAAVAQLRDEGFTVLIVEQNVHRTLQLADFSYVLNHGEVVMSGTPDELSNERGLVDAYLGGS